MINIREVNSPYWLALLKISFYVSSEKLEIHHQNKKMFFFVLFPSELVHLLTMFFFFCKFVGKR